MIQALFLKRKSFSFLQIKLLNLEDKNKDGRNMLFLSSSILKCIFSFLQANKWDALSNMHSCQIPSCKQSHAHEFAKTWYSPCFGWGCTLAVMHRSLPLVLLCSFVIHSARSNLTYLFSNPGRFPSATDRLLLLHQLIRADNFVTHIILQTCSHIKKYILLKMISIILNKYKYYNKIPIPLLLLKCDCCNYCWLFLWLSNSIVSV